MDAAAGLPDHDITAKKRRLRRVRFGPSTMVVIGFLAVPSFLLVNAGFGYLAILAGIAAVVIVAVKAAEQIQLEEIRERQMVGQRCLVVRKVGRSGRGIVKVLKDDGSPEHELWSAESQHEIFEDEIARIIGLKSIILMIER